MIFFFIKTTKHLDIRREKKFLLVGCCIDKRKKKSGCRQNKNTYVFCYLEQQQRENVREQW